MIKINKDNKEEKKDISLIVKNGEEGIVDRIIRDKNLDGY